MVKHHGLASGTSVDASVRNHLCVEVARNRKKNKTGYNRHHPCGKALLSKRVRDDECRCEKNETQPYGATPDPVIRSELRKNAKRIKHDSEFQDGYRRCVPLRGEPFLQACKSRAQDWCGGDKHEAESTGMDSGCHAAQKAICVYRVGAVLHGDEVAGAGHAS